MSTTHDLGTAVIERAIAWHQAWNWQTTKPDDYRDAIADLVGAVDRFSAMERAMGSAHEPSA